MKSEYFEGGFWTAVSWTVEQLTAWVVQLGWCTKLIQKWLFQVTPRLRIQLATLGLSLSLAGLGRTMHGYTATRLQWSEVLQA